MGPLVAFWALWLGVLADPARRRAAWARGGRAWALDLVNLGIQGTLVPLVGAWAGAALWARWLPGGVLPLGLVGGFLLNVVVVDYLYYWNHRLLHVAWPLHRVHHTAPAMDVLVSSRNTLWTSFFIVYVWVHGLCLHLLDDPRGYALGAGLTAMLDLWRHSPFQLAVPGLLTPRDHAWHHSADQHDVNFGANWDLWDRLHGTLHRPTDAPARLGEPTGLPAWRDWLWPFEARA